MVLSKQEIEDIMNRCDCYRPSILMTCMFLFDYRKDIAEECTQEAYIALYQHLNAPEKEPIRNDKAWLYKVAYNRVNHQYTILKKERRHLISMETELDCAHETEIAYEPDWAGVCLDEGKIEQFRQEILQDLSQEERCLFQLVYMEKLKYKEIANRQGIDENLVKQKKFRLAKKLKSFVQRKLEVL